jgi:hypothetical protein
MVYPANYLCIMRHMCNILRDILRSFSTSPVVNLPQHVGDRMYSFMLLEIRGSHKSIAARDACDGNLIHSQRKHSRSACTNNERCADYSLEYKYNLPKQ